MDQEEQEEESAPGGGGEIQKRGKERNRRGQGEGRGGGGEGEGGLGEGLFVCLWCKRGMGKAAVVVAGVAIVCAAAACAAAAVVVSSRMRVRSQRRHARNVLQEFQEACSTPLPRLRQVVDAMAVEMHAGLVSEGGSRLKMLPTFVDRLPHGYVCMHGGSKTLERNQTRSKLASFFSFFLLFAM